MSERTDELMNTRGGGLTGRRDDQRHTITRAQEFLEDDQKSHKINLAKSQPLGPEIHANSRHKPDL